MLLPSEIYKLIEMVVVYIYIRAHVAHSGHKKMKVAAILPVFSRILFREKAGEGGGNEN